MFEIECEKIIYGKNKHTAFCENISVETDG